MKTFFPVLFTVLVVGGIAGIYFLGAKNSKNNLPSPAKLTVAPSKPLVGSDRDAHGCIGSAGYSWCELKKKCLRVWEEPCSNITVAVSNLPTKNAVPSIDETENLKVFIKSMLVAKHGSTAQNLVVTVTKIEGDYAKGMASEQGGGGIWFAAKVSGAWKLVWDGNGIINCSDISAYPDFSNTLIPECYDKTSQKTLQR